MTTTRRTVTLATRVALLLSLVCLGLDAAPASAADGQGTFAIRGTVLDPAYPAPGRGFVLGDITFVSPGTTLPGDTVPVLVTSVVGPVATDQTRYNQNEYPQTTFTEQNPASGATRRGSFHEVVQTGNELLVSGNVVIVGGQHTFVGLKATEVDGTNHLDFDVVLTGGPRYNGINLGPAMTGLHTARLTLFVDGTTVTGGWVLNDWNRNGLDGSVTGTLDGNSLSVALTKGPGGIGVFAGSTGGGTLEGTLVAGVLTAHGTLDITY